jgi:hypothetical protein
MTAGCTGPTPLEFTVIDIKKFCQADGGTDSFDHLVDILTVSIKTFFSLADFLSI